MYFMIVQKERFKLENFLTSQKKSLLNNELNIKRKFQGDRIQKIKGNF